MAGQHLRDLRMQVLGGERVRVNAHQTSVEPYRGFPPTLEVDVRCAVCDGLPEKGSKIHRATFGALRRLRRDRAAERAAAPRRSADRRVRCGATRRARRPSSMLPGAVRLELFL